MVHSSPQTFMWLGKPPSPLTPTPLNAPPLQTQILRLTPLSLSLSVALSDCRALVGPIRSPQDNECPGSSQPPHTDWGVSRTHSPPLSSSSNLHLLLSPTGSGFEMFLLYFNSLTLLCAKTCMCKNCSFSTNRFYSSDHCRPFCRPVLH